MLRFDDSLQSQWLNVLHVLEQYHFRAIFLAITSALEPEGTGYPLQYAWETMSWTEMSYLCNDRNEIADHSATHKELNSQSCSGLNFQIYQSRQALFSHNMIFISVFVDPSTFGAANLTVADYLCFWFFFHVSDNQLLKREAAFLARDGDVPGNPAQSLSYFESIGNQANSTNVIGVYYHNLNDHMLCCSQFYTNTTIFDEEMALLYQNHFTTVLPDRLPWY